MKEAQDLYGTYGAVPTAKSEVNPTPSMGERASPADFGAQVGQAEEKLGGTTEELGLHYAQMATEAHAEDILANQFTPAAAQLREGFYQLKGKAAFDAQPAYNQSLINLRNQFLNQQDVSSAAKQIMGQYMARHAAQETDFAGRYAVTQLDDYMKQSNEGFNNAQINSAVNNYTDPNAVKVALDSLDGSIQKFGIDTGKPQNFITQEQQHARGVAIDGMVRRAASNGDLTGSKAIYDAYKNTLNVEAQDKIENFLTPKIKDYDSYATSNSVLQNSQIDWRNQTYGKPEISNAEGPTQKNASSSRSNPNNLGNVKTAEGARNNTPDFVQPATPVDGVAITVNNLRSKNYAGKTLNEIGHTWTSTNPDDWVRNVSKASGLSPDAIPNLTDSKEVSALMKGIATAEKSPADRARFTDDIISQGVQQALTGKQASTLPNQPKQTYPDYLRSNGPEIVKQAYNNALQQYSNDIEHAQKTADRTQIEINKTFQQQENAYKADTDFVLQSVWRAQNNGQLVSIDDLAHSDPKVQQAWSNINEYQPVVAARILNSLSNPKKGDGYGYMKVANLITAGRDTPDRITGYSQLIKHFNDKELTPEGLKKANALLQASPETKANSKLQNIVFENLHNEISPKYMREISPENEEKWADAYIALNNALEKNRTDNIPDRDSLDRNNKNYIGNVIKPMLDNQNTGEAIGNNLKPKIQSNITDKLLYDPYMEKSLRQDFDSGKYKTNKQAGLMAISDAVNKRKISVAVANDMAVKYGYYYGE